MCVFVITTPSGVCVRVRCNAVADLSYTRDTGTFARQQIERDRVPAPPLPPVLSAVAVEGFRRGEGNCGHSFPCTVGG